MKLLTKKDNKYINNNILSKYYSYFVLCIYIFITVIFFIPNIINLKTEVMGVGGDHFQQLATVYNQEKTFIQDGNLDYFKVIKFYTNPRKLFDLHSVLFVFHIIFGEPLAYNLLLIISFPIAAFGMYLLTNYFIKNKAAAFFSGIIYGFAPYHVMHSLGHFGAMHIEWIPFLILFIFKYFKKASIKNAIFSLLFFCLAVFTESHYAAYLTILIFFIFVYHLIFYRSYLKKKRFIITTTIILAIGGSLLVYYYLPLIKISLLENNYLDPGFWQVERFSADLISFVTPFFLHPIWGKFFGENISFKFTEGEMGSMYYLGFSIIFFMIISFIYKSKNKEENRQKLFWQILTVLFLFFSLGPYLHILGDLTKIPLSYFILYKIVPFFNNIRATGRIFIIALLSLSIVVGFGIKYILEKYVKIRKCAILILPSIFIMIILEYIFIMPSSSVKIPDFYNKIKNNNETYSIIQIPCATSDLCYSKTQYYNSQNNKKILGKINTARDIPGSFSLEKETPIINSLLYGFTIFGHDLDFVKQSDNRLSNYILRKNNVKYIVILKEFIQGGEESQSIKLENFLNLKKYIETSINYSEKTEDKDTLVYEIGYQPNKDIILSEGENWSSYTENNEENNIYKWSLNNSTLIVNNFSKENKKIKLYFEINSREEFRRVNILLNDNIKGGYVVGPIRKAYEIYIDDLKPGENEIKFNIADINNNPQIVNNEDERFKTIAISNVKYEEVNDITIPKIYYDINGSNIWQYPVHTNYSFEPEMYGEKKILDSKLIDYDMNKTNIVDDYKNNIFSYPFLNMDRKINNGIKLEIFNNLDAIKENVIQQKIEYVVMNKKYLLDVEKSNYQELINKLDLFDFFYEDDELLVFKLKNDSENNYIQEFLKEIGNNGDFEEKAILNMYYKNTSYFNKENFQYYIKQDDFLTEIKYPYSSNNALQADYAIFYNVDMDSIITKPYPGAEFANPKDKFELQKIYSKKLTDEQEASLYEIKNVPKMAISANNIPHITGKIIQQDNKDILFAQRDVDKAAFMAFGPYWSLPKGQYKISFNLKGENINDKNSEENAAFIEISDLNKQEVIKRENISPQDISNIFKKHSIIFENSGADKNLEFKLFYNNVMDLYLKSIEIEQI